MALILVANLLIALAFADACDTSVKNDGMWYWPLNIPGEGRTVMTPDECRQRCVDHPDCFYFNHFPNRGCHLSGKDATLRSVPHNPTFRSGAVRCDHRIFSQKAASGECLSSKNNDVGLVLGNTPHTIQVRLTFPESAPSGNARQWILNLGQGHTGDHHWIWKWNTRVQFGKWWGAQIQVATINRCTELTTTSSGSVLKLYCNGRLMAEENVDFWIDSPQLYIGRSPIAAERDFAGCISEVTIWTYEKSADEVFNLEWEALGTGVCVAEDGQMYTRAILFAGEHLLAGEHGFSGTKESCKQLCATYASCIGINFVNHLEFDFDTYICQLLSGDGLPIDEAGGIWGAGSGTGPIDHVVPVQFARSWECHRLIREL